MFLDTPPIPQRGQASDMGELLDLVAHTSTRPRYAFMVLSLIAEIARPDGSAGPMVMHGGRATLLRDWLCDALAPMGARDPKRLMLAEKVRAEVMISGKAPEEPQAVEEAIAAEVHERIRKSGKTNLSRAVSELVQAGLIRRHYQGFRVDHHNRGAGRHVVYALVGRARCLMGRSSPSPLPIAVDRRQGELRLN
jgi:DNA-binding transcriptional ArsR family regulator